MKEVTKSEFLDLMRVQLKDRSHTCGIIYLHNPTTKDSHAIYAKTIVNVPDPDTGNNLCYAHCLNSVKGDEKPMIHVDRPGSRFFAVACSISTP